jgi:hypothetical protein
MHIDELDWKIKKLECQGNCSQHVGSVFLVGIYDPESDVDWGYYRYCARACMEDRRSGLKVIGYGLEEPESELQTYNLKNRIQKILKEIKRT